MWLCHQVHRAHRAHWRLLTRNEEAFQVISQSGGEDPLMWGNRSGCSKSGVSNSRPAGQLRPAGRYFVAPTFIWKFNVSAAREFCIVATPLLAAVWDNVMMFWFPTVCLSSECSMHVSDMGGGVVCGVVCVCEWEREPREKRVAFDVRRAGGWKS